MNHIISIFYQLLLNLVEGIRKSDEQGTVSVMKMCFLSIHILIRPSVNVRFLWAAARARSAANHYVTMLDVCLIDGICAANMTYLHCGNVIINGRYFM